MSEPDRQHREDPIEAAIEVRLQEFARSLGLEAPFFDAPLTAFVFGGEQYPDDSVFLGGDLHAVHPEPADRRSRGGRDQKLDGATIFVGDHEDEPLQAGAVGGIWCLALPEDLARSSSLLTLYDSDGRLRIWLLLPPARQMIGAGHRWLPSVPPAPPGPPPRPY